MAKQQFLKKGREAYERAMNFLKGEDFKSAEAEFEGAREYLDTLKGGVRNRDADRLLEELRGWASFTKGRRAMEFAKEAEQLEDLKMAASTYRKAYSHFFQSLEAFSAIDSKEGMEKARGYMNMANGLSFSSEGDFAFDGDEYTKSVEFYQKALSYFSMAKKNFATIGDSERVEEVENMLSHTNADVWISEGHYNILLSKQTGEDELLARAEYEKTAAEDFKKSLEFLKEMKNEDL
ncbi:MAG TPA: hypothetical protein ENN76_00370, partial [Euryarchaeota archaeon]|nr:hypothetical protein [Euryarchaeota archaeon]